MAINSINTALLKKMFLAGVARLEANKDWINELNVFPVPDGDTGTNMTLTILSAAREVSLLPDAPAMKDLSKAISSGSLRGARGNSGVILSQLFRGFTKEAKQYEEIGIQEFAAAFQRATETAYKAVMKPKEGTILTVARGISDKAMEIVSTETELEKFFTAVIEEGDRQLERTPELLPVLKEAGVVDSGGQGLMQFLKGALEGYLGKEVVLNLDDPKEEAPEEKKEEPVLPGVYCVEYLLHPSGSFLPEQERALRRLMPDGPCAIIRTESGDIRVHIHTEQPGAALQSAMDYGFLTGIRINNLRDEHHICTREAELTETEKTEADAAAVEVPAPKPEPKEYAFISVSPGPGLSEIFRGLGVEYIIDGGQSMNPSTEDMLHAIDEANAKAIFIFPNNKNIILAANQARDLVEDKQVFVIPTTSVPQGITAVINFAPDLSMEENAANMLEDIKAVRTGQITYSIRDTSVDGFEVHKDDIIGIGDSGFLAAGTNLEEVTIQTIQAMAEDDAELISIYYGEDINEDTANALLEKLQEIYPSIDIEVNNGGQNIYYYIVSVE